MKSKNIQFRDPVVERVVDKFVSRSDLGFAKYGRTLDSERTEKLKGLIGYLTDVQEELMDAILYIQSAREELLDQQEATEQARMDIIGRNGNDGIHYSAELGSD
jgi:hypothetical protein|tara:strand:- start:1656 stop:1967 length:312 start_codon:yes stop_codon:yes gene_type:complete